MFDRGDGSPVSPSFWSHAFAKIARKAGHKGVTIHGLRHYCAGAMLDHDVSDALGGSA